MAKKKKKGASQPQQLKSPGTKGTPTKQPTGEQSTPEEECCCLELKIRRSETKAPSAPLKLDSSPVVFIDEVDASKLRLQKGAKVALFLKDQDRNTNSLAGALVCKVDISSSVRSPDNKNTKRKTHVVPGTCNLQPLHLLDSIFQPCDNLVKNVTLPNQQTPIHSPPPSTPQSTPRSGFSFAKGGGGDALINSPPFSPTSPYSTPQAGQNVKSYLTAWMIPLSSALGEDVASVVFQDAKRLNIRVENEHESSRLRDCSDILKALFAAQTLGLYVHEKSTVVISFRGKPLELQVEQIEIQNGANEDRSQLLMELEMEEMEIREEENTDFESQLWTRLRAGLEDGTTAQHLLLHRIGQETEITFSSSKSPEEGTPTSISIGASESTSPRPVVAGLTSSLEKLKSFLLTPLLKPELFVRGSLKPPRGLLLHGSSGVGKSCLARQLALDLEHEFPRVIRVESVNCASLQSYSAQVGEAEQRLCRIFEKASLPSSESGTDKNVGTLLIFDDIHLICSKRSGYSATSDRLAATLLGLLDGIGSASSKQRNSTGGAISSSIVILAITGDPSKLDPALRRPGRLDFEVEVPGPDSAASRAEIFRFHIEELGQDYTMPRLTGEDFLRLGEKARGFSGADCMLAVKESIRIAMSRDPFIMYGPARKIEVEDSNTNTPGSERLNLADLESAIKKIKPSAIKSITVEIPTVLWSSIGGMEKVKEELREAIELPDTHASLFQQLRIPPPRGILLYGPPGCSKTLMARALATEGKMNFLAVKGPELLSKWLGESERALASLFRRARVAAPSIIFFDEIDAIAAQRGSGGIGTGGGRLLSQLLTELDGINSTGGVNFGGESKKNARVVVVAATNRPDLIDKALMRPGRIDRKIYVGAPDEKSRHRIFEIGLQGRSCSDDIDVSQLSEEGVSGGFSGAELIAVCKDAALLALEEDETCNVSKEMPRIQMRHLLRSINGMQRQITPAMNEFYESFRKSQRR